MHLWRSKELTYLIPTLELCIHVFTNLGKKNNQFCKGRQLSVSFPILPTFAKFAMVNVLKFHTPTFLPNGKCKQCKGAV